MKMKKILATLLAVCMIAGVLPATVFATSDEHVIQSAEDWAAFAASIANGEYCADTWKLGADITVTTNIHTSDYALYPTVGTETHPFEGVFDGQGHTLTVAILDAYYLNEQQNPGVAPFRFIAGATIRNLTVEGSVEGPGYSAGLVSYNQSGSSLIENCLVYTDVSHQTGNIQRSGGVLGNNMTSTVTMRNVVYGGTLYNSLYNHNVAGGLIGWSDRSTVILENCIFSGECTGAVEAFSPILIVNPRIDSLTHDAMNVTYTNVYYTVEPSVVFDERTIGQYVINDTVSRLIFKGAPENGIYEHVLGADGLDYHIPCSVEGVQSNYPENASLTYTVKNFAGETLTTQYYTATLTKNGNTVSAIGSEGTYTFTITGKNGYTGTYTKVIHVYGAVPYVGADGSAQSASSYLPITSEATQWSNLTFINHGWYVVFGDVMIDSTVTVTDDINLILCDGAFLNAEEGINIESSASLTVWAQSAGDGRLQVASDHAIRAYGDLTINGGIILADSLDGPAIGGGTSNITINGGDVTARANGGGAGISASGTLTINGGTVTAYGDYGGAGIGGDWASGAGTITINGGIINAYGGNMSGAGIGSGRGGSGGSITINGGMIRAYGGEPEDIPTARRYDIGADRGDAIITFDYTDESADTMSVIAGVYAGTVKLLRTFYDAETLTRYSVTNNQDVSAIGGKTLIPYARVCTISFRRGLGTGEMESVLTVKGEEYVLPANGFTPPSAERPFLGWIVDTVEDEPVLMQPGDTIIPTDNVRITAKYISEYNALQSLIDSAENGATITLDQDYIAEDDDEDTVFTVPAGKTVTIDLAGHTIDRGLSAGSAKADGNVFIVNGTLTVKDTSANGTGTVTGGNGTNAGGAFRVLTGGVFTLEGGTVTGNRSTNGGAIYNVGTVTVSGGVIENNTASNSGGGVFNNTAGTLNLTGGRIENNTAGSGYHGGGIHNSGTLNVSGDPVVKDNTRGGAVNNVGLYEGAVINVTGALSDTASIGVNKSRANSADSEAGVFTSGLEGNGTAWVFKADSAAQRALPFEGEASLYSSDIYYITIVHNGNGTVTTDSLYARQGDRLGFVSTANAGYRERSFTVKDDAGNSVSVSFGTEKNWVYMPASNITVTAVFDPYYLISVDQNVPHGTVNLQWTWAYAGQTVPLSATADSNYVLSEWVVTDADGDPVATTASDFVMPSSNVTVSAVFEPVENPEGPVPYVDANGNAMTPVTTYTTVGSNTRIDTTGWYVVKSNVGVGRQIIYGDVNIILCDNMTLTVNYGIFLYDGASLTIWQQEGGTGGLRVENITIEESPAVNGPGNVTLTVNGGSVYAEGYPGGDRFDDPVGGAGIFVKNLIVNAGSVTAVGGRHAAGIGGGEDQGGASVTINGGYVRSTGGTNGAGIGGGYGGNGGTIVINGGTVDAVSGARGAGIGGGRGASGGTITINGGTILAAGYEGGAGIGGGNSGEGGIIAISGGSVKATSYYTGNQPSYAIGAGSGVSAASITLGWTASSRAGMRVDAASYSGTVTLTNNFTDGSDVFESGVITDLSALSDKVLTPFPNPETDLAIAGRTLIFDSTFSARYLIRKDLFDLYLADGMSVSSFTVTVKGETRDLSGVIGSAQTITVEGVEYYWAKVTGIAAKDADTPFTFSLVCLYGGVEYTDTYTDSVKAALEKAAEGENAAFADAANATLAYCAAAATAFGKDAGAYAFDPVTPVTGVTEIATYKEGSGVITICGTSVILKDELALRFWANPGAFTGSIDDLVLKVNGTAVEAEREINGGYFVFRVSVPIDRMQTAMTVELFLNGESVSNRFTDSVMNYALCLTLDAYGFDAKYRALGRATMDYIAYTNLYLASLA